MVRKIIGKIYRRIRRYGVKRFEAPFRKLKLEDRAWVDPIFYADTNMLPHAHFVEMYLTQAVFKTDTYRRFSDCVVKIPWIQDEALQWQYPIGAPENRRKAIEKVLKIYAPNYKEVVFHGVPEDGLRALREQFGEKITSVEEHPDASCYILDVQEQIELPGGKFRNKRKKIQRFHSNYNWTVEPISAENMDECMQINAVWLEGRKGQDVSMEQIMLAIALREMKELKLDGELFRIDGKPAAFYIGMPFNDKTYFSMFIKSDNSYQDISLTATHEFFKIHCRGFQYDNEDCDGDVLGLREFKTNLHPVFMVPYYSVTIKGS